MSYGNRPPPTGKWRKWWFCRIDPPKQNEIDWEKYIQDRTNKISK